MTQSNIQILEILSDLIAKVYHSEGKIEIRNTIIIPNGKNGKIILDMELVLKLVA